MSVRVSPAILRHVLQLLHPMPLSSHPMANSPFPVGKLPHDVLQRMLERHTKADPSVLVGPGVGMDAAVIDFGGKCLVAKTDPITFATDRIGWYAVNISANDIAATGARPRWFLATVLLPEGKADEDLVESIFLDLASSCDELGITLCGGHTEVTYGLDRPVVIGQLLGEAERGRISTSADARPGDRLLLTKGIVVEGTAILAREKRDELLEQFSAGFLDRCAGFLDDPGISVVREAIALSEACDRVAMHDPTEGGLATALYEMATASGVGMFIERDAVPVFPETERLCDLYQLDPWGLIASGSLLAAVGPSEAGKAIEAIEQAGVECYQIGEVLPRGSGLKIKTGEQVTDLPTFEADELGKVFGDGS